jgi:hypothetical protein
MKNGPRNPNADAPSAGNTFQAAPFASARRRRSTRTTGANSEVRITNPAAASTNSPAWSASAATM